MNGANGANGYGSDESDEPDHQIRDNVQEENEQEANEAPADQNLNGPQAEPNRAPNVFDQPNNNGQVRNRHANGAIGLEGFAQEWFRNRRIGLARLENRPREREAYNLAMDRLFLNAERVSS